MWSASSEVALVDRRLLRRVRVRDRAVGQDVRGDGGVDRDRHVGVDQRHGRALRELLAGDLVQLLACKGLVARLLGHRSFPSSGSSVVAEASGSGSWAGGSSPAGCERPTFTTTSALKSSATSSPSCV